MVVFLCFGSYILQPNIIFKIKIGLYVLTKLRSENLWKLRTAIIKRPIKLPLIICHKKSSFLRFFFYETRANTQQVLSVQTGLYRYDE